MITEHISRVMGGKEQACKPKCRKLKIEPPGLLTVISVGKGNIAMGRDGVLWEKELVKV